MPAEWRRLLLAIAPLFLAALFLAFVDQANSRVGVLDLAKVVKESPRARAFEQELAEKFESLQAELKEMPAGLSEAERARREEQVTQAYLDFKEQLEKRLEREIDEAVAAVAKDQRIDVVVFKESVRYGGIDITADVIKRLR